MTREEFLALAKAMQTTYQRNNFLKEPEAVAIWYNLLSDIPYPVASVALQRYMMTSKWPPTIADIREEAMKVSQPEMIDSGEAWELVIKAVRKFGYYDQQGALNSLPPLVREAAERFGFRELCDCNVENINTARAQFMRIYDQLVNRQRQDAVLPIAMHEEIARLRDNTLKMLDEKGA